MIVLICRESSFMLYVLECKWGDLKKKGIMTFKGTSRNKQSGSHTHSRSGHLKRSVGCTVLCFCTKENKANKRLSFMGLP